jgi:hypothetical protein
MIAMGWLHMVFATAVVLTLPQKLSGQSSRINAVAPLTVKVADTLTATGEGIDKERVDTLYLTDGRMTSKSPSRADGHGDEVHGAGDRKARSLRTDDPHHRIAFAADGNAS